MAALFTGEYFYDIYRAPLKRRHIFSLKSFIDILTIIPGYCINFYSMKNRAIAGLAFLRSLRIFRFFDLTFTILSFSIGDNEDEYEKLLEVTEKIYNLRLQIYKIITHLICMIFISTNFIMTIQEVYRGKTLITIIKLF